jgi:iron-only hydrogenase group A
MSITIRVDRQKIEAEDGQNLLEVLKNNQINLPEFSAKLPSGQTVTTALVEDFQTKQVKPAAEIQVKDRMRIGLNSGFARQQRQEALRMVKLNHLQTCPICQTGTACDFIHQLNQYFDYDLIISQEKKLKLHPMAQAAELDPAICIGCNKCVEACERTGIGFLKLEGEESNKHVAISQDKNVDCIYCGQCTLACPVKAAREQSQIQQVEEILADRNLITIVQMAPSVRVSIGEEFGQEIGVNLEKKMFSAFRRLGFDYVFDVNMGADITTLVEAEELVERLQNGGKLPMFTSCCPAWVKFLEFYYPDMLEHLTEARSPHIHSGGAYKTWWADKVGIDPEKIRVVSIMPCTSKKYESRHEKLKIDGQWPVDYVLTTRETAYLLKKHQIDLPNLEDGELDEFGQYSGAAAIYGASGGVMESALRTAANLLEGKDLSKLEFEAVRGIKGIKKTEVELAGQTLRVAVVQMAKNMHKIIQEIKTNPEAYHYVEFMACPGGCIGGGGQPQPASDEKTAKRIQGLYAIDDVMQMRQAHENPVAREFVQYAQQDENKKRKLLYTHYSAKKKFE